MSASTASEPSAPPPYERPAAPAPEIVRSGAPSLISRLFAIVLRITLRPWIALSAWLSGIGIRIGPPGVEMWRIWETMIRLMTDSIAALNPAPRDTVIERVNLPACKAELVRARDVAPGGPYVLYFHGGGYVACGLSSHRRLVARISRAAGATVFNVAYRLLPRSAIKLAIEDGVAAYRKLLEDGIEPSQIVIAGDSAGGGLSFLIANATRAEGLPMPAGIVAISPWGDLDSTDKLTHRNARTDPLIPIKAAAFVVDRLIRKGGELDQQLSPINLDLSGLPPVLIHVGTTEVLELDALNLGERLAEAGVPVRVKLWQGQVHDFQLLGVDLLPEARAAIAEIGEFVSQATSASR
jgi:acetyl esterase/lipase